ncbi:MAG TPA: hypothetical protein VF121_03445 [Thermoanaerobaculia bacterium]|nr:hypothetical protein [Thermoanaerobaculia bacterium]
MTELDVIWTLLILASLIALAVKATLIAVGAPAWAYYLTLPIVAFALYVANSVLMKHYIARRAPDFASHEEFRPGIQKWELTAGTGIVPKWVSLIGLASIAALLALLFPLFAALMRRFGLT